MNCACVIAVGTHGPQQQAPDLNGHYRTSTASARCARSQWATGPQHQVPDRSGTTGPQQHAPDGNGRYRTLHIPDLRSKCHTLDRNRRWALPGISKCEIAMCITGPQQQKQLGVATTGPQQQAPDRSGSQQEAPDRSEHYRDCSGHCQTSARNSERQIAVGTTGSLWALPDPNVHQAADRRAHYRTPTPNARSQ